MRRAGCALGLGAGVLAVLAGCAWRPSTRGPRVNTGLKTILSDRPPPATLAKAPPKTIPPDPFEKTDLADLLRRQAIDTQKILEALDNPASGASEPVPLPRTTPDAPSPLGTNRPAPRVEVESAPRPPAPADSAAHEPAPADAEHTPVPTVPIEKPLGQRLDDAAVILQDLLREQAAASPDMASLLALAAMEAVRPGSTPSLPLPTDPVGVALTPAQAAIVEAYRGATEALAATAARDDTADEESDLADTLGELAARVASGQPLRIRDARLCSRVRGFGQYAAFGDAEGGGTARFVAGRAQRVIVYVELDRFAHRELIAGDAPGSREPGDRWAVELSQEINVYSDSGNLLVDRRPPERVLETSRVKRLDFYLVTDATLPGTLGAGRYNFKITVRDATSGAVAERVIPVELVADAAMTRTGR